MTRSQQPALTPFAVGMIGLGILALVYGDFALVWQPVASWIPGRTVLAYGSGLIMVLVGVITENPVRISNFLLGETDRGFLEAAKPLCSESQIGECKCGVYRREEIRSRR